MVGVDWAGYGIALTNRRAPLFDLKVVTAGVAGIMSCIVQRFLRLPNHQQGSSLQKIGSICGDFSALNAVVRFISTTASVSGVALFWGIYLCRTKCCF